MAIFAKPIQTIRPSLPLLGSNAQGESILYEEVLINEQVVNQPRAIFSDEKIADSMAFTLNDYPNVVAAKDKWFQAYTQLWSQLSEVVPRESDSVDPDPIAEFRSTILWRMRALAKKVQPSDVIYTDVQAILQTLEKG